MLKKNDKIKVHLYDTNSREIKTRNHNKIFTVKEENEKLGIDWNESKFEPFEHFSYTVQFENVDTGEKFHCNSFTNQLEKTE